MSISSERFDLRDYLREMPTEEILVQLALGSLSEVARWELLWITEDGQVLRELTKDSSARVQANAAFRFKMRNYTW